jgi:hypothetical protein
MPVKILAIALLAVSLCGCANIPVKDGGLVVGKDTTASVDDVGVARLTGQF